MALSRGTETTSELTGGTETGWMTGELATVVTALTEVTAWSTMAGGGGVDLTVEGVVSSGELGVVDAAELSALSCQYKS